MLICSERHREPPPRRYNVPAPHAVNKHLVTRRTNGHGARNHKVHAEADRRHITTKICDGCRRISTVCFKKKSPDCASFIRLPPAVAPLSADQKPRRTRSFAPDNDAIHSGESLTFAKARRLFHIEAKAAEIPPYRPRSFTLINLT